MKRKVSKMILLVATVLVVFSGCHKDKKISKPDDPSRIFIAYSLKYQEGSDSVIIFPDLLLDNESGQKAYPPEPFEIRFNGVLLNRDYYLLVKAPVDTAVLVYTDKTGANYSVVVNPIKLRQIPDTFTSVTRNSESYFHWKGDSTGYNEEAEISFMNIDSLTGYATKAGPFSDFIALYNGLLALLKPGTNNTYVNFQVSRSYNLLFGAPKGVTIKQEIYAKGKIITVY